MVFTERQVEKSQSSTSLSLMELHKKFRRVLRKSISGKKVHLHDLKLCLDLFAMEHQNMPNNTLQTQHINNTIISHRSIGEMKAVLSLACILEMQAWDDAFQNKQDTAPANPELSPKLFLTAMQIQELYNGKMFQTNNSIPESFSELYESLKDEQKQDKHQLGERLFVLISQQYGFPALAGKITGMLLELESDELFSLLKSPRDLLARIVEALCILRRLQEQRELQEQRDSGPEQASPSDSELELESNSGDSETCEWSNDWLTQEREWGLDLDDKNSTT